MRTLCIFILAVLSLVGCAAESSDGPPDPLKCKSVGLVMTPDGVRLQVECNHDAPEPPVTCERQSEGVYICNIYHASEADCNALPGICDPPSE